jgi:hypothetical protein
MSLAALIEAEDSITADGANTAWIQSEALLRLEQHTTRPAENSAVDRIVVAIGGRHIRGVFNAVRRRRDGRSD